MTSATSLQSFLVAQVERRLRENAQAHLLKARGLSPEAAFEAGWRATITALEDVFSSENARPDLRELLALEASKLLNAGPHPRSRVYRSEPAGWNIVDTKAADILTAIRRRAQGGEAGCTVVFDLDGTLFDVSHRTLGILREWLSSPDAKKHPRALVRRVECIAYCHMGYSLAHAFENAGLDLRNQDVADMLHAAEKHWRRRFFDGKTLVDFDVPVSGAPEFVAAVRAAGLHICYLTGRDHRGMHAGTVRQLEKNGFPVEGCTLLLKQNHEEEDHVFKQAAFAAVAERSTVVGNFENEYINIGQMAPRAPEAIHVVVDTQHSGRPVADLAVTVFRLQDFS